MGAASAGAATEVGGVGGGGGFCDSLGEEVEARRDRDDFSVKARTFGRQRRG